MADVQAQFEQFHGVIRIDFESSQDLRDKRDILVRKIERHLADAGRPGIKVLLQGSYAMKTGVLPIRDLEYDIDVGLRFFIDPDAYEPTEVRGWIWEAVKDHTDDVDSRGPCIRVRYSGEQYHVDLVTYAVQERDDEHHEYALAHKTRGWRPADPPALREAFDQRRAPFAELADSATNTDQFRRCVRYLRRWSDVRIPGDSKARPSGLGFVLLCADSLTPRAFVSGQPDDRGALETLAQSLGFASGRLEACKPTPEYEDVLADLSDAEMEALKDGFKAMFEALRVAAETSDRTEACKALREVFGDDFPVPDPDESARRTAAPAVVTTSTSA